MTSVRSETSGTATSHHQPPSVGRARRIGVDADHRSAIGGARALQRSFQSGDASALSPPTHRATPHARRSRRAARRADLHAVVEQVVERRATAGLLQPVDAAVAAVVEQHNDQLEAEHHRGRDLGIHHQVAAVADDDDDFAVRAGHLHTEPAGDLVTHARVAVLEVIAAGHRRAPELVQFAGSPPAAQTTMSRVAESAVERCTAPMTSPS